MTGEQRVAFEQIRPLAAPLRLRVKRDAEGFPMVPGRLGQVEWAAGPDLAVYTPRRRMFDKVLAIPGVRRHQTGDTEMRAFFPPSVLPQVAQVIRARVRRVGGASPEMLARARASRGAVAGGLLTATSGLRDGRCDLGPRTGSRSAA